MSTISVELSRNLVEAHGRHGTAYVSAPVFGRPEAAEAAKLFIVAAGPKPAVAKCEPLFSAMGQKTFVLGENPPAANVLKLSGNFLIVSTLECMGEAFALVRKYGIDPQQYLDILSNSFFSAPFQKNYGGIIAQEKYEPAGFSLRLGAKDVRLILAAADAANVPMPVASVLHDRFLTGISRGMGEKDWSAIAQLAGRECGAEVIPATESGGGRGSGRWHPLWLSLVQISTRKTAAGEVGGFCDACPNPRRPTWRNELVNFGSRHSAGGPVDMKAQEASRTLRIDVDH